MKDYETRIDPDTLATVIAMPTAEKVARDVQATIARDHEGKVADALIRLGWTPPHAGLVSTHHSDENDIVNRLSRWHGCWQVRLPDDWVEGSVLPDLATAEIERLRVLFRVHMLRFAPNVTHAEIDAVLYPAVPEMPTS